MTEQRYTVLDWAIDLWYYGCDEQDVEEKQRTGWSAAEIDELARGWDVVRDELLEQCEVIEP